MSDLTKEKMSVRLMKAHLVMKEMPNFSAAADELRSLSLEAAQFEQICEAVVLNYFDENTTGDEQSIAYQARGLLRQYK